MRPGERCDRPEDAPGHDEAPAGAVGPVMVGIGIAVAALRAITDTPVGKS